MNARRLFSFLATLFVLTAGLATLIGDAGHAEQQLDCPAGMTVTANGAGTRGICVTTPPLTRPTFVSAEAVPATISVGQSAQLRWTLAGGAPTQQTIEPGIGTVSATTRTRTVAPLVTTTYTILASNAAGASTTPVLVTVTVKPPEIFGGAIDPTSLGNCTAAAHDKHTVIVAGEARLFRTWHTQIDALAGCTYAHEHGDDPRRLDPGAGTLAMPAFGLIVSRTPGHPTEPHEGYKCFVSNRGEVNDEGRGNRVYSRSCFHMGTLGPARFEQPHHSAEILVVHPEFNLRAYTQLMMDTGGFAGVCDPRVGPVNKDGLVLGTCKVNSLYEIWTTAQSVRAPGGAEVYRAFATPAVFDPITGFDPANPTRVLYLWDKAIDSLLNFPGNDRTYVRGCDRESYAQPGYWYNAAGPTVYWTNSMGAPVASTDPLALRQEISTSNSVNAPATTDGLSAFKMHVRYCDGVEIVNGGKTQPRSFIAGTTNRAALKLRN